jgi:phosphate-selective porin OprO/OprP
MNFNKKLATAVSGAVLLMAGHIALADSTTDIVDALVSKGVLTEEEGKLLTKGHTSAKEKQPTIKEKDGAFSISSPNGKNSIQLTGRLHFDTKVSDINQSDLLISGGAVSNNDTDSKSLGDHFNIRRARLGVKGRLGGVADYEIVGNFAGTAGIDVAYMDINKYEPLGLTFGKFKVAPNLEIKTSSNNIDMIERSYVSQNVPEKRFGAALHGEFKGFTYFGSAFQNNDSAQSMTDNKVATAGRATINFAELSDNKDMVIHAGLNGYSSNYQLQASITNNTNSNSQTARGTLFGFTAGGQGLANSYRAQIADTGVNGSTNAAYGAPSPNAVNAHSDNVGIEGILAYQNFKLQGEYSQAFFKAGSSLGESIQADVDTWYAEALWTLTGEKYADAYKKGAFGGLKPKNEFNLDTGSGYGLWEIGARIDAFDVSNTSLTTAAAASTRFQGAVNTNAGSSATSADTCTAAGATTGSLTGAGCGGGAKSYTASIKWLWNPNMVFKANYTYTRFDNSFTPIDIGADTSRTAGVNRIADESLFLLRGQYMF